MTIESDPLAVDTRLAELLASRLCHDLASPVGAVMSGLELMQEFEDETAEDALKLMGDSARIAACRLAFYRLAFGAAGNAASLVIGEARRVTTDFLAGGRVQLNWPERAEIDTHAPAAGATKLLLMLVFVAAESLPRGGVVAVGFDSGGAAVRIEAVGVGARLAPIAVTALGGGAIDPSGLDAATAPACYAGRVALRLRVPVAVLPDADRLRLEARLP